MAVVRVPRTPRSSFKKDRRPSALLLDQIKHLEWAALPAAQRKPNQVKRHPKVKSEAQAAERIAQLTMMVLDAKNGGPYAAPVDGVQPKVKLPPLPTVPRVPRVPTKRRASKKRPTRRRKARLRQRPGTPQKRAQGSRRAGGRR